MHKQFQDTSINRNTKVINSNYTIKKIKFFFKFLFVGNSSSREKLIQKSIHQNKSSDGLTKGRATF